MTINLKNRNATIITLLFGSSLTIMASATIAPAQPAMAEAFKDAPHAELLTKLILTFPALFIAAFAPLGGVILDKFGRMKFLFFGLFTYAVAGTSGFFITNLYLLLASRALLGIGVAAIMTSCTTLIGDYFEGDERNKIMGFQGAFMAVGGVVYIILGGALAEVDWNYPFLVYLASIIAIPLAFLFLTEPDKYKNINKGSSLAEKEEKEKFPVNPVLWIYIIGLIGMVCFYMVPVQIPELIMTTTGVSEFMAGIAIACSTLTGSIISMFYWKVKGRISFSMIFGLTFLLMGAGFIIISFASTYIIFITGLVVNGLGMGLMMPNGSLWLISSSPAITRGRIIGGMTTAIFTGQFLSPIVMYPVIDKWGLAETFRLTGIFLGLLFLFFLLLNLRIIKLPLKENS